MRELADAVGHRYQVDPAQILARLQKGRFRVKVNLALTEAQSFMAYLESRGALCSIVDEQDRVVKRSGAHTPPPIPSAPVKALIPEGPLQLAMLDEGSSEVSSRAASVANTSDSHAFLPPDATSEAALELVVEPKAPVAPAFVPDASPTPPASAPPQPSSTQPASTPPAKSGPLAAIASSERIRLAVGVVLVLLVGFIVSSSLGSSLEKRRYSSAVDELKVAYHEVDSPEAWKELDTLRVTTIETLERRRKNVVITSSLVWLAISGLLLWLWLRMIPWARMGRHSLAEN